MNLNAVEPDIKQELTEKWVHKAIALFISYGAERYVTDVRVRSLVGRFRKVIPSTVNVITLLSSPHKQTFSFQKNILLS